MQNSKLKKFLLKSCCGSTTVAYTIGKPLTEEFADNLVENFFELDDTFKKAGLLYAKDEEFIVTGPFGSNRIQVKCRKKNCHSNLIKLETLLESLI